ncbi:MAG TPA: helix-turn-helix domain-containing protein [Geminicoccaceae bacterium]|nr:helix-turn-helix domain-containing protein [Geminicoccaceae bacterium]
MHRLSFGRRAQVIRCLVEGSSIRSTERMTGVHRDTIMRLLVEVGAGCERLLDARTRGLGCRRLQMDEIWRFVAYRCLGRRVFPRPAST